MKRLWVCLLLSIAAFSAGDPWAPGDLAKPESVAKDIHTPLLLHVGFDVLYRASHITGSVYAGPASKPEGIEALKKAVAGQPKDRDIVLYCGCCPLDKCPNIRPAFTALHEAGFTRVRVMEIPQNLKTDWSDKGFPVERRTETQWSTGSPLLPLRPFQNQNQANSTTLPWMWHSACP
jgi:thiosulfate/3-mercaptopyruvate sulfurtransferase